MSDLFYKWLGPILLGILMVYIGLLFYYVGHQVQRADTCELIGGTLVSGTCINNAVIIKLEEDQ